MNAPRDAAVQLRVLGSLDLRGRDGREASRLLAQPRRVALLAYLALLPTGYHQRATLLALFWPDSTEARARASLRQSLYVLRGALGPDVVVGRGDEELRVDPERCWCDAAAFEAALDAGDPATAAALYRGDLLDGFGIADGPEFERWLEERRARLLRGYVGALEALAIRAEERDDHAAAAAHWHRLVERVPENGRAVLRLMQALARGGDRPAALREAQRHATYLQREFGAEPDPAIPALVELLRRP